MKKFFTFTDTSESPRVFSAVPTMGDKNLPRNQSISVIFSKAMNINTCVQSFSISPPNQGFYELAENTLKFTPSALFAYGSYTYTITKNCEDKEGRDLKDVWTASFTVGEATIAGTFPEVKSATVATGTTNACNSASGIQTNFLANSVTNACMGNSTVNKVTVQFSRPMDRSLTQSSVALSQVTNVSYLWESDTVLTLVPDFPFAYNQRVTLNIATTAADQFGIKLQTPVTASFLIGTPNLVPTVTNITVPADTLANCSIGGVVPTSILSGNVTNGCLGNPTRSDIVFTFSTSMEPAITQNGIVFSPSLQGTYVWSNNNTTLTFTPDSLLSYGTRYTASLGSSVQSTLRVPLLAPFSASFIAGGTTPFNPIASHTTFTGTVVNCNGGLGIATDFSVVNVTDGCLGNPTLNPIVITFLVAMDKIPTQNAVIISGGVTGTYAWSVGDTVLTFTPDNYLTYGTRYTVTLGVGAKTATGIATTTSTSASFIAGGTTPFNPLLSMNTNFGTLAACNAGTGVLNDFLANPTLTNGCLGNPTTNPIVINFSFPMDPIPTQSALTISPSISGTFAWTVGNTVLTFTPDSKLNYGTRYTVTLGALAKTSNGIPVSSSTSTSFVVGSVITSPAVQAFGVSSQGCSATFPGIGSAIGANWASPTCYWDSSLAIQTPSFYTFRAGDTGSGSTGSPLSCADANTDNFKIIFNSYMDLNSTVNAVRLRRLSPPTTSIQLASWQWTDCQGTFPFGCRVLTVVFAEQEASCNGTLFGNAATGGDFNLLRTDNMPVGSPFYLLSVDTTAKDTSGVSLPSTFNFSMEGK